MQRLIDRRDILNTARIDEECDNGVHHRSGVRPTVMRSLMPYFRKVIDLRSF
jgi:hypothetical protein